MNFDSTVTISIVLALVALVSPSVTAVINNKHIEKMKKLELQNKQYETEHQEMRNKFSEFTNAYGVYISYPSPNNLGVAKGACYSVLTYIPDDKKKAFEKLIATLSLNDQATEAIMFHEIIPIIHEVIGK